MREPQPIKSLLVDFTPKKTTVITKDGTELTRENIVIIATWLQPKYPDKPTYAYTMSNMVKSIEGKGILIKSWLHLVIIQLNTVKQQCAKVIVYDNRNLYPFPIIAMYQNGNWIETQHPNSKQLIQAVK